METRAQVNFYAVRLSAAAALAALAAWLYYPTLGWLYERYTAADTYYSHGFLVPAVTCWLIWKRRDVLKGIPVRSSPGGLLICLAALSVYLASVRLRFYSAGGFSLFFLVVGSVLFLFGTKITGRILAPILFLLFMLPLPLIAVNSISFPLKVLVAHNTALILKYACGLPMQLQGFQIIFPRASLTIENPCSGLRSIIVMLALGFVLACLSRSSAPKKLALFLFSVPIALVSNILRVLMLSLAVYVYGERMAEGLFHDLTGYLAFAGSLYAMYGCGRFLR